ncbi:MAG: LPXTG cell wall anchor domain-containing protein, partial [Promicromonosporaceae bacterium]|nr:LPXTG cell wall anchor domain-containing protein [Promicromonosporaceae bacterium]
NIRGTGVSTNRNVGGQDDWQVTITEEIFDFEMPPLPDTGGPGTNWVTWVALVVLAAAGAFALLVVVNKRKAVPAPART